MIDKDKIDDIYRDGFDDFELPVSDKLLSNIKQELIVPKSKKKFGFKGWLISFVIVAVAIVGAYFIYSSTDSNTNNQLANSSNTEKNVSENQNNSEMENSAAENDASANSVSDESTAQTIDENGLNMNDENAKATNNEAINDSENSSGNKTQVNAEEKDDKSVSKKDLAAKKDSKYLDRNIPADKKDIKQIDKKDLAKKDSKHLNKNKPEDKKESKHIDKNAPEAAKDSKHLDKNKPEDKKDSKHIDKNTPEAAKDSKHLDKNEPEDKKESKHLAKNAPEAAKDSKHLDKNEPADKKESKHIDKNEPEVAKDSKQIDKNNLSTPEENKNKSADEKNAENRAAAVSDSLKKVEDAKKEADEAIALEKAKTPTAPEEDKSKKAKAQFFVDVNGGMVLSYRKLTGSNAALQSRNDNEKNLLTSAFGVDFGAIVNDKLIISLGAGLDNKGEKYTSPSQNAILDTVMIPIIDSGNITGYTIDTTKFQPAIDGSTTKNRYQFLRIPVMIGYQFKVKEKWVIAPSIGVNINYLLAGSASWMTADSITMTNTYAKSDFNKFTVAGRIKLDIGFNVNEKCTISIQPGYTRFLQSIYRKDTEFKHVPYSYDLNIGLRYKF